MGIALSLAAAVAGIVYGEAGGEKLTMDYHRGAGSGPFPAAILIEESAGECVRILAPAGYAVFAIHPGPAARSLYPAIIEDARMAVNFVRRNAPRWNVDGRKIVLIGGYLSNMAGVQAGKSVQAVVTFFGPSDFRGQPINENLRGLLGPLIAAKGEAAALEEASPVMHIRPGAPPFLLIHGDQDEVVPLAQSTHLQLALQKARARCDLIIIQNGGHGAAGWRSLPGVRDWEGEMIEWLRVTLNQKTRRSAI